MNNNSANQEIPFFDHCFDKGRLKKWITKIYYETIFTEDLTILNFVETLKTIGFREATRAGVSIGIDDLRIPPQKTVLLQDIEYEVENTSWEFSMNRLTALENFQSFIDTWHRTSEMIKKEVVDNFEQTDTLNPVYMMAFSGARGNLSQVTQLVGMRGFMSDPEGQIIDYPIRSNFREGLTLTEYVISCYGARKGLVDTALRTADAGYLTRRLVDVAHSVVITRFDCKTTQGIWLSAIQENSKTLYPLEKRLVGRVLAENIYFPYTDKETNIKKAIFWSYFKKNQQIDSVRAKLLASCFNRVLVRSPLRCLKKKRVCQLCYGWTLPHAHLAPIGEAVGILAAQSIGEPGTQLTMRTFHTGGVFSGALSEELKSPYSGRIQYNKPIKGAVFRANNGQLAFRTKESGTLTIQPTALGEGFKTFELNFPPASILFLKNSEYVQKDDLLVELPKEQEVGKETVLNTYTYYSKRSGLLKVYKTALEPNESYDLISHPKLPKIEPFYERAQYINRTFHSFKIYAGQISKVTRVNRILPQTGDLINTKSLVNLAQLISPLSSQLAIDNDFTLGSMFPQLHVTKPIFNLPLYHSKYRQSLGYISNFGENIELVLPALNELNQPFNSHFELNLGANQPQTGGKLFYPIIFSHLLNNKGRSEKLIYAAQRINFFGNRLTLHELIKWNKYKPQSSFEFQSQAYFYVPQPTYKSFGLRNKRANLSVLQRLATRQIRGRVLSTYKTRPSYIKNNNFPNVNWVPQNTRICDQKNLQTNIRSASAKLDGFVKKKSLVDRQKLLFTRKWVKTGPSTYWETITKYSFKVGWPYLLFSQKLGIIDHQKFRFSGQNFGQSVCFNTKCTYTEPIIQKSTTCYLSSKLVDCSVYLSKTNVLLAPPTNGYVISLIQSAQELSLVKFNTTNQTQVYKNSLYNESSFEKFKKVQKLCLKTGTKKTLLQQLLSQVNKQRVTSNNSFELSRQRSCLQIKTFLKKLPVRTIGNSGHNSKVVYEKTYRKSPNLVQCLFKVPTNYYFNSLALKFTSTNQFNREYSYGLAQSLRGENYFKNGPWNTNFILCPKKAKISHSRRISTNQPFLQSHFLSCYSGELVVTKEKKDNEIHSLTLTNYDTCTIRVLRAEHQFQIGDPIYQGMELTSGKSSPVAGQVIQVSKTHIKLQLVENSLVASNSRFFCQNDQFIEKTSQLFTQSYPRLQMGDIVQGIPKIEEFFEARQTKEGQLFDNNLHNRLKKRFRFYRKNCQYPLFIAARKSIYDIQNYIIDSIFKLYNSQGIDLSDKHLEIIVRQMTSKVRVTQFWKYGTPFVPFKHPLPTELYSRHYIERYQYRKKNTRMYNVRYEPAVLGITSAALENDGFISAASFQETTRILSRGAIFQKKDYLKGLKENVILGHIIPAGTSVRTYSRRFKPPVMEQVLAQQALQVLTINHEWKLGVVDENQTSIQYFNPIRYNLLRLICLEYFHVI